MPAEKASSPDLLTKAPALPDECENAPDLTAEDEKILREIWAEEPADPSLGEE